MRLAKIYPIIYNTSMFSLIKIKLLAVAFSIAIFLKLLSTPVMAVEGQVLGIHILGIQELDAATQLLRNSETVNQEAWHYVTVPITLNDLTKKNEWQIFFNNAQKQQIIPIVRIATRVEDSSWQVPTRKEITLLLTFLSDLNWPTEQKHIIVLNETNHAKEFGGEISPEKYAEILRFTSLWAKSENKNFVILPAAMDLAAPNGSETMEAFNYFNKMLAFDPDIFTYIDYLNSHAYPNPGFSSAPQRKGQNSLEGFKYELAYLKEKTGKDFEVFITETGWVENKSTSRWLSSYYEYAMQHIWSDSRVKAVTPFILQGSPGPFAGFSFLDAAGKPTKQYLAYKRILENKF